MPRSWGTELFRRFEVLYRAKFTDNFPAENDVAEWVSIWTRALAGTTGEQIKIGLERCAREREWPPIAPAEFLPLCTPRAEDLGIPSADEAFVVACHASRPGSSLSMSDDMGRRWKHAIVLHVVRDVRIDMFNLAQQRSSDAMKTWRPVYSEYVHRMANGEQFLFPGEQMLEDRTRKAVTPAERKESRKRGLEALRTIKRTLGVHHKLTSWDELNGMRALV